MKKYIFFIVGIGIILAGLLIFNVYNVQKENTKIFEDPGYILKSASSESQKVDKYYFNADEEYRIKNNQTVIFKDTSGDEVTTDKVNFIHYNNGSISSLKKGVLINLANIEQDPITYYSIAANQVVNKQGDNYWIDHLGGRLQFTNLIWKISDNKYLIAGNGMTVTFNDGTTNEINGYLELEYLDNQVIKIYNQEIIYQTISSNVNIQLPDNIEINLQSKAVSKNGETRMNLANMVIDSDDNVEIQEQPEQENNDLNEIEGILQNQVDAQQAAQDAENANNGENDGVAGQGGSAQTGEGAVGTDGTTGTGEGGSSNSQVNGGGSESIVQDLPELVAPVFNVESFNVDSISVNAQITIQDDEARLVRNPYIKILENSTGKTVYAREESIGTYNIDVSVSTLTPDTDYTLVVESAYDVDGVTYTKNFVYKIFRTQSVGITFEKDVFTNSSLKFKITVNPDSKVKSAQLALVSSNGTVEQTYEVGNGTLAGETAEFIGLQSNTQYTIRLTNVLYDGQIISNGFEQEKTFTTLKDKPEVSGPEYEMNKRDSTFTLRLTNVIDPDNGIQGYRYEIYDTRTGLDEAPVYTKEVSSNEEIIVNVDEKIISRGVPYTFKVIALFNDNEKIVEYESEYSDIMKMDGVAFPTVRFEKETITYERIQGKLIIEDPNNTISTDETNTLLVTYTDSTGYTRQFSYHGGLTIPIDINDLRSNETYKFRVYTTVDLKDENDPIDECYIGGAIIKTLTPDTLMGSFIQNNEDTRNTFNLSFKLRRVNDDTSGSIDTVNPDDETLKDLEANTLANLEFRIYAGQPIENADGTVTMPGTPIRTVNIKDEYSQDPYKSKIKEEYYDTSKTITPKFFGAENKDFRDQKYTIEVLNAFDYTYDGGNKIPLTEGLGYNYYVITANGYIPDYPTQTEQAIDVTPIRNRDIESPRAELDAQTVVGYKAQAKYDNSQNYATSVVYTMIDSSTGKVIGTQELPVGEDGVIPAATFDVGDGTKYGTQDTDQARRGNSYYFTYKVYLDLNHDGTGETEWPLPTDNVTLRSQTVTAQKQAPRIIMYPSISTENTITYKYKCADIDNALEKDEFYAYINTSNKKDTKAINANTGNTFEEVTFENLIAGNLEIRTATRLIKINTATETTLGYQYFEGKIDISDLTYRVELEENSVSITVSGDEAKLDRLTALKVTFEDTASRTVRIVQDLQVVNNNMLTVSFNDISDLLDLETEVTVEAYYDTGVTGYDTQSDYVAYQKTYKSGEQVYYYSINREGNLVPTTSVNSNMFESTNANTDSETSETFNLINPIDSSITALELNYSQNGFTYQNDVVLQKEIGLQKLTTDGSNIIKFNLIIPGISMLKDGSTSELDINEELDRVQINATLINKDTIEIKDNMIIVELWKTDENLSNSEKVRDIEIPVSDFSGTIEINNLEPKTYYYIRFKTNIRNKNEVSQDYTEKYLYDVDADTVGRYYYFSTLANVNVDNINVVYDPVTYNEKYVKVTYTLDKVLGYQKLRHVIYRWSDETQDYTEEVANFEDDLPKAQMEEKVSANPGSIFTFGTKYKIVITPIAVIADESVEGGQKEIDLGTKEQEFYLNPLSSPLVAIQGYRQDTVKEDGQIETGTKIRFTVTMYDDDKIAVNDKYTVKIYNQNHEEITPEEYKGEYNTTDVNNEFILENVAKDQSYTLEVNFELDYTNDGQEPYTHDNRNTRTVEPINESGISAGNITSVNNSTETNKIDLLFYNSYKIEEIKQIKYSIYNTSGYNQSDTEDFIPNKTTSITDNETYYSFTLNKNLPTEGRYYIEIQFLDENGDIVDTASIEHIYIAN